MSAYGFARRPVSEGSVSSGRGFRLGLATLIFLLALPAAADAYTLVLRSGRHVTVPEDFKVTPKSVTYEASPGFSVTVWLSNVDFAATEKANAEPEGSFARRIERETEGAAAATARASGVAQTGRRAGPRVVTNKELEPSRLKREAQEEEYERTRRERGMPSRQELRQRFEEQERRLHELARRAEAERVEAELESLRSELANVRRHLGVLNFQLSQRAVAYAPAYATPDYYPYFYAPPSQVINVPPFGHRGRFGRGGFGPHPHARQWPRNTPPGHFSPAYVGPSRNAGAMPPAAFAPRRGR
jgi:hypothetical protein